MVALKGNWYPCPISAAFLISIALSASGQETIEPDQDTGLSWRYTGKVEAAPGVLPQLGVLLRVPDNLQLRDPSASKVPDEPIRYDRLFPLLGEEAINRGYALPLPIGLTLLGVDNVQEQNLSNLSVTLGKGFEPSKDDLKETPFVSFENVRSSTRSKQLKADVWVLPFLNLFATVGQLDGEVGLDVLLDLADIGPLPPGAGLPDNLRLNFTANIDAVTTTVGAIGVYGIGNWWGSLNAAHTITVSSNSETDIRSTTAGLRVGRRFEFGNGHMASPYLGASYLDVDTVIEGVYKVEDAFDDGDDLNIRYKVRQENVNKYSAVLGLNLGFRNGTSVQAEFNRNGGGDERVVLSATYRF
ncbi:autotransporter outer membrane beta-barrel domain-containing protein [Aliiruegeria lutimaris]|uniref:autotransporter outer membrane beta-barrel domain-containing protein n=1 Tax=Aliiruegeria lutimaris TaxID=571298 RepID=UPI00111352A5|nr:autotransporter outer membrane beta-barrel domain-containing protein [Aliiruegeria lutimaris]